MKRGTCHAIFRTLLTGGPASDSSFRAEREDSKEVWEPVSCKRERAMRNLRVSRSSQCDHLVRGQTLSPIVHVAKVSVASCPKYR